MCKFNSPITRYQYAQGQLPDSRFRLAIPLNRRRVIGTMEIDYEQKNHQ